MELNFDINSLTLDKQTLIVGIGQGGGNVTDEFAAINYDTLAINSSNEDLRTLRNVKDTLHLKNGEGAERNSEVGELLSYQNMPLIEKTIDKLFLGKKKVLFFVMSGGGGTGSGGGPAIARAYIEHYNELVEKAREDYDALLNEITDIEDLIDVPEPTLTDAAFCAIVLVPSTNDLSKVNSNAADCLDNLNKIEGLGAVFLVENSNVEGNNFKELNQRVAQSINDLLCCTKNESRYASLGVIDKRDLRSTLKTSGHAFFRYLKGVEGGSYTKRIIETFSGKDDTFVDREPKQSFNILTAMLPAVTDSSEDESTAIAKLDTRALREHLGDFFDPQLTYSDKDRPFVCLFGCRMSSDRAKVITDIVQEGAKILTDTYSHKTTSLFGDTLVSLKDAERKVKSVVSNSSTQRKSFELVIEEPKKPETDGDATEVKEEVAATKEDVKLSRLERMRQIAKMK